MAARQRTSKDTGSDTSEEHLREEAIRRRRRLLTIVGASVAGAVAVGVLLIVLNRREGDGGSAAIDAAGFRTPTSEIDGAIPRDGRMIGDPAAPIVVVEFADYQCPFCTGFGLTGLPKLLDEYVATGQVRLEYSHFIVIDADGPDGESARAAEAAECARDQGKFWEMHELLVANSLGEYRGSFTPERLKEIGRLVDGLDQTAFGSCVDARTHRRDVIQTVAAGKAAGVSRTPTFTVNGQLVSGDYAQLKEVIDALLAAR